MKQILPTVLNALRSKIITLKKSSALLVMLLPTNSVNRRRTSWLMSLMMMLTFLFGLNGFAQTTIIDPATAGAFEGATFAADGWSVLNNTSGAASWVKSTGATTGFSGLQCAYITSNTAGVPPPHTYTNSGSKASALYRDVTIPAGETTISLSFKWICVGESGWDRMQVWAVPTSYTPLNGSVSMTTTGTAPTGRVQLGAGSAGYQSSGSWTTANFTIPAAYAGTTFRLVFQWRNDGSGGSNPPAAIDDVSLTSLCSGPVAITASTITLISADANWNAFSGATSYDVRYRLIGSSTWTTITSIVGTTSPLTGLTGFSSYEYQVKANGPVCGAFSNSVTFYTGHCIPAPSSVDGTGITNVSFGTVNNTTGAESGNFGNYSAQIGSAYQGAVLNTNITFATGGYAYGTQIWVDWNDDLVFTNATELMYTGLSAATNPTTLGASFTVPITATVGNHRMRIGATDTDSGPGTACYTGTYGTFEDYTLQVLLTVACAGTPAPGNTVASPSAVVIGGTSTLSLATATAGTGVTYQWQSGPSNTGPWANVGTSAATYTATITAATWYKCAVTCSGVTTTSNPVQVTLAYCQPVTSSGCTDGDVIARVVLNTLDNNSGTGCPS